jgi:hypothetical protein
VHDDVNAWPCASASPFTVDVYARPSTDTKYASRWEVTIAGWLGRGGHLATEALEDISPLRDETPFHARTVATFTSLQTARTPRVARISLSCAAGRGASTVNALALVHGEALMSSCTTGRARDLNGNVTVT